MTATLTTFRDRVEQVLQDETNVIWDTDVLDEAIRQALHEYSQVRPYETNGTVNLSSDSREIDISSLTGLVSISEIWADYTASDPEFPPNRREFEFWPDEVKIYLNDAGYEPASGDVMRVFYTKIHTLNGLDSETTTTFPDSDESLLVIGATGYAATSRAVDLVEQVALDRLSASQLRAWGLAQLQRFRTGLKAVAEARAMDHSARVPQKKIDRWDGRWS